MSEDNNRPHKQIIFTTRIKAATWNQIGRHLSALRGGIVLTQQLDNAAATDGISKGTVTIAENTDVQSFGWDWTEHEREALSFNDCQTQADQKVTFLKNELFEMLDIIHEMANWCASNMPVELYMQTANAVWVLAHRAADRHGDADMLKDALIEQRRFRR